MLEAINSDHQRMLTAASWWPPREDSRPAACRVRFADRKCRYVVERGRWRWQGSLMSPLTLIMLLTVAATAHASGPREDGVKRFVRETLQTSSYRRADADLNGDGRKESFVLLTGPSYCGSAGCLLLVLSPRGSSYRLVMRATVINTPITVLRGAAHGWRDVGVTVRGGGIVHPYMALLRYDGRRYVSNPTNPPAVRLRRPAGKVLIVLK